MNGSSDEDDSTISDEQMRRHIQVLSARLYDLRERFMKVVQKINNDAKDFDNQKCDEDDTSDADSISGEEMSIDPGGASSSTSSNEAGDEHHTKPSKVPSSIRKVLIESILQRKAHRHEYIKNIDQYPKIIKYLIDDNPRHISIPLRYLEPFVIAHVSRNPTGKIYDQVNQHIQDIRRSYLKHQQ